jgi:RNA polymerase sigma-70 factor (ECF subfamily)
VSEVFPSRDDADIQLARCGDEDAFARLVDAHFARVARLARLYLDDPQLADDVAHDVFVRLFRSINSFRGDAALPTWLHRVTINLCHDATRRRRRDQRLRPLDEAADVAAGPASDPELAALRAAGDAALERAVGALPEPLRLVLACRLATGATYAEIGRTLDLPLGTVCTRMQRATRLLARALAQSSGGHGHV